MGIDRVLSGNKICPPLILWGCSEIIVIIHIKLPLLNQIGKKIIKNSSSSANSPVMTILFFEPKKKALILVLRLLDLLDLLAFLVSCNILKISYVKLW